MNLAHEPCSTFLKDLRTEAEAKAKGYLYKLATTEDVLLGSERRYFTIVDVRSGCTLFTGFAHCAADARRQAITNLIKFNAPN